MRDLNLNNIPEKWYLEYHGTNIGIPVAHSPVEIFIIEHMIFQSGITNVVELGVWFGGLTGLLLPVVDGRYIGIDIADFRYPPCKSMFEHYGNAKFIISSFDDPKLVEIVREFINLSGKILVYLDNGKKYDEILLYAPLLKNGDIIIAHDYSVEWNIDIKMTDMINEFNISIPYIEKLRELGSKQMIFVKG